MESPLRHAPDLRLIETLFWDGTRCPLLPFHLARLTAGAKTLGWALPDITPTGPQGTPARLRLLVGPESHTLTAAPVPAPIPCWRLMIAPTRLVSTDPWLRIKSTHRPAYDATRAALPPTADEAIFLNEQGEVCDGTITTLFFDRGEGLRTPPLSAGLLPGVLRASLIADGLPEQTLHARDLPHVRLWVGNALRGLNEARIADSFTREWV